MVLSLLTLAMAYVRDDRSEAAHPLCERSRDLLRMTLSFAHPVEAVIYATSAEHFLSRQRTDEAIEACDVSRRILWQSNSRDGFAMSRIDRIEGEATLVAGHIPCAFSLFTRSLTIWQGPGAAAQM
ncbi:MAG: hypothetical protein U0996_25460 [Planctomycetaceae bacterium]